jgi:hypothetical protein
VTRTEFAAAVRGLLTDDQRRQIRDLHDQLEDTWLDGCAAADRGMECCVDVLAGERQGDAGPKPPPDTSWIQMVEIKEGI